MFLFNDMKCYLISDDQNDEIKSYRHFVPYIL